MSRRGPRALALSLVLSRSLLATAVLPALLAAAFAGCAGAAPGDEGPGAGQPAGDGQTQTQAEAPRPSPWPDGRWVEYRVASPHFASGPVVAVARGGAFVADSRRWAVEDATRDVPLLGALDPATLATTAFGGPWDVLRLPLADGERWTAAVRVPDEVGALEDATLELSARAATVFTPTRQEDGFLVEGRAGGRLVLETSYSPSMHLPTFLRISSPSGNVTWQAVAAAEGDAWDGPLWSATAEVLVDAWSLMAPNESLAGPPSPGGPLLAEFEAGAPGEAVYGYLVAVAFGGAQEVSLVAPSGRRLSATAAGVGWDALVVDEPTEPGRWQVVAAGGGAVAFAGAWLWSVAAAELSPSGAR